MTNDPKQSSISVSPSYDADANMITNNVWSYTWISLRHAGLRLDTDGNHIIAEMSESETNYFTWANGETLTASLGGETVFYCHDANKNTTDLVDDSGDSVAHYEYSPFGVITTDPTGTLSADNPFRFSSEYFDSTTGLVEYKYRKYNPDFGKFLSRDPIEEQGGLNLYAICGNDLINFTDRFGMSKSFYANGIDLLRFRLAAEEQYVTKKFNSDSEALRASNQVDDWGPLHVGSIKDVQMFLGNTIIDANSIINTGGKVYIYAHGSVNGDIDIGGGASISPNDIEAAYYRTGLQTQLRGVWALSCHFGNKDGGAQQWHNILGIPIVGHKGKAQLTANAHIKYTDSGNKTQSGKNYLKNQFMTLINTAWTNGMSYDEFYKSWEGLFNKWEEMGCIEKAYWHVYDVTPIYNKY